MTQVADLIEGLNPAQREAVETVDGPLLIVAGPGSGKTRVITHRIAYLVQVCGISPYSILAMTFTNKAAREMRDRLVRLTGPHADALSVGTFHSFCARLLRRDGEFIGLSRNYSIFDDDDQIAAIKRCLEKADYDPKRYPPRAVLAAISRAKNVLQDSSAMAREVQGNYFEEVSARVYRHYEETAGPQQRRGLRRPAAPDSAAVPRVPRGAATLPGPLRVPDGGRVPGHQCGPVPAIPAAFPGASETSASWGIPTSQFTRGAVPMCATS